jgi:ABC-type transporter Mla subunit MlaD
MNTPSDNMGSELRSDAEQLSSKAGNRLHSELDARKGTAADQAKSVSTAIERAADGLDENSPQWLRSAFQQGAQQIRRFADTLEQKDSREIFEDVKTFARDNPTTFLAACAAAGFAASRLFKAGANDGQGTRQAGFASANQGPPPAVDEPMFRDPSTGTARQSTGGEFA